jgi:hypothetical protein
MPLRGAVGVVRRWLEAVGRRVFRSERSELVLDVVEEILGIVGEFAAGVEGETAAKGVGGAGIERADVELRIRGAAPDLVRGELVAPTDGVPDACVVRSQYGGAVDESQALSVMAAAGYQERRHVLEGLHVIGVELQGTAREIETRSDVVC